MNRPISVLSIQVHPAYSDFAKQYDIAQREFREVVQRYTRTTWDNREFILVSEVTRCLKQRSQSCHSELQHDLQRLLLTSHHSFSLPPPGLSLTELDEYLSVFYILVDIECPQLIDLFTKHGLNDKRLPFNKSDLLETIKADETGLASNFHGLFLARQLRWCPVTFDIGMGMHFDCRVIPICFREEIKPQREHSKLLPKRSTLWKISVPEELVSPAMQLRVPFSRTETGPDGFNGDESKKFKYLQFAMKQFDATRFGEFEREKVATQALQNEDGIVQYFGWYRTFASPDDSSSRVFNLVLELGEMDFYRAIMYRTAPTLPDEIRAMWESMLDIACSLRSIHSLRKHNIQYTGCHGDIKPENILLVNDRFKLCDSGEARIEVATSSHKLHITMTGGTLTYASPEKSLYWLNPGQISPGSVPQISPKSDVWSLGCVFSIAATYIVHGSQGVVLYNKMRQKANFEHRDGMISDSFHDGSNVLPEVLAWHKYLRMTSRRTDTLTGVILDIVDNHIFQNSDDRVESNFLCKHLTDAIQTNNIEALPDYLIELLGNMDDIEESDAQEISQPIQGILSTTGSNREDDITELTIPTSPSSLQSPGRSDEWSRSRAELLSQSVRPTIQRTQQRQARGSSSSRAEIPHPTRSSTSRSIDTMMPPYTPSVTNTGSLNPENERNIFKVLLELKDLQKETKLSKYFGIQRTKSIKDQKTKAQDELGRHFDNRDIVFLVDNGSTMREHWVLATEVIRALTWRALGYDEDGMELYFTNRNTKVSVRQNRDQSVKDFVNAMRRADPEISTKNDEPAEQTGILIALQRILANYNEARYPKPKTIIILTDGIWEGLATSDAVETLIKSQMKLMGWTSPMVTEASLRPITYQFVRFGRDSLGTERLRRLDDELATSGYPDFVDTEPALGDVYKIFLGSLCSDIDHSINYANSPTPASPSSVAS